MTINMNPPGGGSTNLAPTNTPLMEHTNSSTVEPNNTRLVQLTTPLITITPPRPTDRSTLTYNPTMDYTPTGAVSNQYTPNVGYASFAADGSVLSHNMNHNPTITSSVDYTPTRAASYPFAPVMDYAPSDVRDSMLNPNMNCSPVPGASNMFTFGTGSSGDIRVNSPTPNMNYTPTSNMNYTPRAVPGSMLVRNVDYKPVPGASNMFVLQSGSSGDVRVNTAMGMGRTSPFSATTTTHPTRPNTPGSAIDNPRTTSHGKFYTPARIARGNARAAIHTADQVSAATAAAAAAAHAALQASTTAGDNAAAHPKTSRETTLHHLSLLEEGRRLHLKAFKEHSTSLRGLHAELALMKASPDAEARVHEIEDTESALDVVAQFVEMYGRRFEDLGEEIEELWDALVAPPDDTLGTL